MMSNSSLKLRLQSRWSGESVASSRKSVPTAGKGIQGLQGSLAATPLTTDGLVQASVSKRNRNETLRGSRTRGAGGGASCRKAKNAEGGNRRGAFTDRPNSVSLFLI